jgi:hypothetical protein
MFKSGSDRPALCLFFECSEYTNGDNYSSEILPHTLIPRAPAGTFSGFNCISCGSGFGPTSTKIAYGPSSGMGKLVLDSIPAPLRTPTKALAASLLLAAPLRDSASGIPRRGPTHAWTRMPSENWRGVAIGPENGFHAASLRSINRICPAALLGSKSDWETTRTEMSEKDFNFWPVSFCSKILGDIAASNDKFFSRNCCACNYNTEARHSSFRSLTPLDQYWIKRNATVAIAARAVAPPEISSPHHDRSNQIFALSNSGGATGSDSKTISLILLLYPSSRFV